MSRQQQVEIDAQAQAKGRETTPPWGERLRETRIRRGLSIEEVANTLLLEVSLIEAIEREACDELPGASFVKGYLRNYAKLLEVDSEPLVEAYRKVCGNDEPELTQVTKIKDVSSSDAAPRYAGWLVLIVIVVSFGIWWWSEVPVPSSGTDTPAGDTAVPSEAPPIESPLQSDTPFLPEPPPAPPVEPQAPVSESPAAEAQGENGTTATETDTESAGVSTATPDTLRLTFTEDSWVEIEDARGEQVYMDLARAGETEVVKGQAPFEVLLGNAPAVTVEYNNEVYDHAEYNRKGVARFTLGE